MAKEIYLYLFGPGLLGAALFAYIAWAALGTYWDKKRDKKRPTAPALDRRVKTVSEKKPERTTQATLDRRVQQDDADFDAWIKEGNAWIKGPRRTA